MKKLILNIVLIISSVVAVGQSFETLDYYLSESRFSSGVSYYGDVGSKSINTEFSKGVYSGINISNALKENFSKQLTNQNIIASNFSFNAFLSKKIKSNSVFIAYNQNSFTTADITKNTFELLLNGNKFFENRTAVLDNSSFTFFNYKKIELGTIQKTMNSEKGLSISYLNGENLTLFNMLEGSIFTAENGEYLSANWNVIAYNTNTSKNFNGNGISFSGYLKKELGKNGFIKLSFSDLGTIIWDKNISKYSSSDSVLFEGITFDSKLQLTDTNLNTLTLNDLRNGFIDSTKTTLQTNLPSYFSLHLEIEHSPKLYLQCGIQQRLDPNFTPYLFINESVKITEKIKTGITLSTGGYSNFNYGLNFQYQTKKYSIVLDSKSLKSLINNNAVLSANIYAGIKISI